MIVIIKVMNLLIKEVEVSFIAKPTSALPVAGFIRSSSGSDCDVK